MHASPFGRRLTAHREVFFIERLPGAPEADQASHGRTFAV
jgi:hypothetical protein